MTSKELEQINIRIAKKLGWKRFRKERLPEPLQAESRMTGLAPGNIRNQYVPNYLGNWAYAMKCVDWAVDHEISFQLSRNSLSHDGYYKAAFYTGKDDSIEIGKLASFAIGIAFLKLK